MYYLNIIFMKRIKQFLTMFICILLFTSCEEQSIKPDDVTSLEQGYLKNLPNDSFFHEFKSSVNGLSGLQVKKGVDISKLQSSFYNTETEAQVLELVTSNFENPEDVIGRLRRFEEAVVNFKRAHEDFYSMDASRRESILLRSLGSSDSNVGGRVFLGRM